MSAPKKSTYISARGHTPGARADGNGGTTSTSMLASLSIALDGENALVSTEPMHVPPGILSIRRAEEIRRANGGTEEPDVPILERVLAIVTAPFRGLYAKLLAMRREAHVKRE